jgi:L-amino acid N-acyltransferase YncA
LKKIIRGNGFNLVKFKAGNEDLYNFVHEIFNEEILKGFINPEYIKFKSKSNVRKWVDSNVKCKCEVWYTIKIKSKYIGFICCKWREEFPEACELSIVLAKGYRSFETGYHIIKTLSDYIVGNKLFKYIIAYSNKTNKLSEKLLKKLGFVKTNKLHKTISYRFYKEDIVANIILNYNLFSISIK